jgi:hypothetical protein
MATMLKSLDDEETSSPCPPLKKRKKSQQALEDWLQGEKVTINTEIDKWLDKEADRKITLSRKALKRLCKWKDDLIDNDEDDDDPSKFILTEIMGQYSEIPEWISCFYVQKGICYSENHPGKYRCEKDGTYYCKYSIKDHMKFECDH